MLWKTSAPSSERNVPEIFCFTFSFRIPLSESLFVGGIAGFSKKLNKWSRHFSSPFFSRVKSFFRCSTLLCSRLSKHFSQGSLSIFTDKSLLRPCMDSWSSSFSSFDHVWPLSNSVRYSNSLNKWAKHTWWPRNSSILSYIKHNEHTKLSSKNSVELSIAEKIWQLIVEVINVIAEILNCDAMALIENIKR